MKLLLDTHIFLWLNQAPERIPAHFLKLCEDTQNHLFLSPASAWEIQIKHQLGKLALDAPTVPFGGIKAEVEPMHVYPLMISASGDPDFPFFVCPVDGEGIEMVPIAAFVRHADALLFVEMAKVKASV